MRHSLQQVLLWLLIGTAWVTYCYRYSAVLVAGMMKISKRSSVGRIDERTFFLFSDVLMYAKPRLLDGAASGAVRAWGGAGGRSSSSPSLVCCCIMPLHHCRVERVFGQCHEADNTEQGTLFSVWCHNITIDIDCLDFKSYIMVAYMYWLNC